jgi:hypothetical protein
MSPNWRFCLKIGLAIALVDFAHLAFTRGQPPTGEFRQLVGLLALAANVMLFSHVGFRTGQQTGRATAAAEAGVLASLLPALAAALYPLVVPSWLDPPDPAQPLLNQIVGVIAFNIVLGGLTAWFSGWIASRARSAAR